MSKNAYIPVSLQLHGMERQYLCFSTTGGIGGWIVTINPEPKLQASQLYRGG